MGWSMELCRKFINSLSLFLFFFCSSAVALEWFHWSCFVYLIGPKKLSRYSSKVVSPSVAGIPWSVYQLYMPLMKKRNSSYWSDEFQSNISGNHFGNPSFKSKPLSEPWWWLHSHVMPPLRHSWWIVKKKYQQAVVEQSHNALSVVHEEIHGTVEKN